MSDLDRVGDADNWRCWLCDGAVDPDASVNADLGFGSERLAHRACNTMKGKVAPVVPWSDELLVAEPAPILETVERLSRKGGRELVARCMTEDDAQAASAWLLDRLSRFAPKMRFETQVNPGGGQFMLMLKIEQKI